MRRTKYWAMSAGALGALWAGCGGTSHYRVEAQEIEATTEEASAESGSGGQRWTTAVDPKPLNGTVNRGIEWLLRTQLESGGWGQGEESQQMGDSMLNLVDKGNVADTSMGALTLIRSGATPSQGPRGEALARALDFVCASIEAFEQDESLWISDVRGTRVQSKIGTYIDTFLASMVLTEVQERMASEKDNERVKAALATVLDKIERNQASDGTWDNNGWAPVLAQSMAGKGLNRAYQLGFDVSLDALESSDDFANAGSGESAPGSAGVALYSSAAGLGAAQEVLNTSVQREGELREQAVNAPTAAGREEAEEELKKIEGFRVANRARKIDLIDRLDDPSFVAGFGSNGGEEFLSYMNISESLVVEADDTWERWDQWVGANLGRVQNQDGSWTGHHCITGRTFCTSAALLTLMADRTPVPVELVAKAQ